jgi:hypothetical protein
MTFWDFVNRAASLASLASTPITIITLIAYLSGWRNKIMKVLAAFIGIFLGLIWAADMAVRAEWSQPQIVDIHDAIFMNEEVKLDNHSYKHCKFYNVTFLYDGTGPVYLEDNEIHGMWLKSDSKEIKSVYYMLAKMGFLKIPVVEGDKFVVPYYDIPDRSRPSPTTPH